MKMASKNYDDSDGVWRTIGGRRVFIRKGQSLSEAMIESGKFKNLRSDYKKAKEEEIGKNKPEGQKTADLIKENNIKTFADEIKERDEKESISHLFDVKETENGYEGKGKELLKFIENEEQDSGVEISDALKDKLRKNPDDTFVFDNENETIVSKKATNAEYELYKKARENEDSIDPMTENSTDWEQLDKKYKERYEKENKSLEENQKELQSKYLEQRNKEAKFERETGKYTGERKQNVGGSYAYKEEQERLDIAKDIAKEVYGLNENNASNERIEKEARKILEFSDGEVLDKDDTPFTNSKGQLERSTKSLEEWRDSLKKDTNNKSETFVQKLDMHGGEIKYDAQRLKEMEAHGTKPMEHSYTGGGWEGTKYDSKLSTKDIAKNITDYSKKEFPDVKLSRKTDYNGIDMYVMSSEKDMFVSEKDIDNMNFSDLEQVTRSNGFNWWAKDNVKDYNTNHSYSIDDVRKYAKEQLNVQKNHDSNPSNDSWYLSDYGKKVISGLNKEMNSYNYDDSDGMVDYFDTNFYGYVHIGKWDKPYEVAGTSMNDKIRDEAFRKYKKEHPNSKITLEQYLKKQ